jgi:hypothetical protein
MTSSDYGTVAFARRLGMEFLRGRPASHSVNIGNGVRSAELLTPDASSGRPASTDCVVDDTSSVPAHELLELLERRDGKS